MAQRWRVRYKPAAAGAAVPEQCNRPPRRHDVSGGRGLAQNFLIMQHRTHTHTQTHAKRDRDRDKESGKQAEGKK